MPIGSHIIPAFYLRQFANAPQRKKGQYRLWVYQKDQLPDYRSTSVQGSENGYFAFVKPDGSADESLESRLALLEGNCLDTLVLTATRFFDIRSQSRRNALAFYAAMLFCRATQRRNRTQRLHSDLHRQFADLAENDEWIAETVFRFANVRGEAIQPQAVKDLIARMAAMSEGTTALRNNFVEDLIDSVEIIKGFLLQKPWQLWNAPPGTEFVTSDNPLISFLPLNNGELNPGHGFRKPEVVAAFPLAPHVCVGMGPTSFRGPESITLDAARVGKINETIIRLCERFVYARTCDDGLRRLTDKYGNTAKYGETAFLPVGLSVPTAKDFVLHYLQLGPWPFARTADHN